MHVVMPDAESGDRAQAAQATNANTPAESISIAPSLKEFRGRVVDDETGQPITDFIVQVGTANPLKPEEIIWNQEFHGPSLRRPWNKHEEGGWFGLQTRKSGRIWARVLATGYVPQTVTPEPVDSPTSLEDLVVRLKRGGELRGFVYDYLGQPVAGAWVYLAGTKGFELVDGNPPSWFKGSAATTDATGQFVLDGVGDGDQKIVVFASHGLVACVVSKAEPVRALTITLPEPAALAVGYDIPGEAPEMELYLMGADPVCVRSELKPVVQNGGQLILTNLLPGNYHFFRMKTLKIAGDALGARGVPCDRQMVVLEAGKTQRVDLVRSTGSFVQGQVTGLDHTDAPGSFVYVRSAEATGDPRNTGEWMHPCFDALACGKDGVFQTALLEPGTYTFVAEAYLPETPEVRYEDGLSVRVYRSGVRLPNYVGTTKVTIHADPPAGLIKIELQPRK
jgi:hypothetical protein